MKLTLTTDDGELLAQWNIEEDFGDITKPIARMQMANEISDEIKSMREFLDEKAREKDAKE